MDVVKKNYNVQVSVVVTVLVLGARSKSDARLFAKEVAPLDRNNAVADIVCTVLDADVDSARAHADSVSEEDE